MSASSRAASALVVLAVGATAGCAGEPDAPRAPLGVGVSLPGYHYDVGAVEEWEEVVGRRADVVQTFVGWEYPDEELSEFPAGRAEQITRPGRTLELTWNPTNPAEGDDQPEFALAGIADGDHDEYVRSFASDVATSGLAVRVRFGHEMNGDWQTYSEQRSGNRPGDFVAAWRHVHGLFEEEGATDVTWVWSPNVVGPGTTPLPGLYPGDEYVDVVGIDGYSYPRQECRGPVEVFGETLRQVRELTRRPVELAEVGVAVGCPDRDRWIADLGRWVEENDVRALTWWERDVEQGDYRVVPDERALAAFRDLVDGG